MNTRTARYRRHRFPPAIISYSVWAFHWFALSFRDVEDLLAERGIIVSYESIRRWCLKCGPRYQRSLKRQEGQLGDQWYADEVVVTIQEQIHYLWRAVDQDGNVLDILMQRRRAAKRLFHKVLKGQGEAARRLFTHKLGSFRVAARELLPGTPHDTSRYANNRVEVSHQPKRQQERQMRRFKSRHQAQRFLSLNARVNNLFRYGPHLLGTGNHRLFRASAFTAWRQVTCA